MKNFTINNLHTICIVIYSFIEFWIGRTKKTQATSLLEFIYNLLKRLAGKNSK